MKHCAVLATAEFLVENWYYDGHFPLIRDFVDGD